MNYTESQLTAAVVSQGLRPVLAGTELGAPSTLLSLIERCWDQNPQKRPSFDHIVVELESMLGRVKEEKALAEPFISSDNHDAVNARSYQQSINWFTVGEDLSKKLSPVPKSGVRIWLESLNDSLIYQPVLSWGSFATCGRRETMEDTHFLMPRICDDNDIHLFGIFDGHRGVPLHIYFQSLWFVWDQTQGIIDFNNR